MTVLTGAKPPYTPRLHALVLVFVPESDWDVLGEDALYGRIDHFYPHGSEMDLDPDDERPLVAR